MRASIWRVLYFVFCFLMCVEKERAGLVLEAADELVSW